MTEEYIVQAHTINGLKSLRDILYIRPLGYEERRDWANWLEAHLDQNIEPFDETEPEK